MSDDKICCRCGRDGHRADHCTQPIFFTVPTPVEKPAERLCKTCQHEKLSGAAEPCKSCLPAGKERPLWVAKEAA